MCEASFSLYAFEIFCAHYIEAVHNYNSCHKPHFLKWFCLQCPWLGGKLVTAVFLHHTTIYLYSSVSLLNVCICKFVPECKYHNSVGEMNKTPCLEGNNVWHFRYTLILLSIPHSAHEKGKDLLLPTAVVCGSLDFGGNKKSKKDLGLWSVWNRREMIRAKESHLQELKLQEKMRKRKNKISTEKNLYIIVDNKAKIVTVSLYVTLTVHVLGWVSRWTCCWDHNGVCEKLVWDYR